MKSFRAMMGVEQSPPQINGKDCVWWPQWDYQRVSVKQADEPMALEFFDEPIGVESSKSADASRRRTQNDTSMYYPNGLPPPQEFYITGIRVMIVPGWMGDPLRDTADEIAFHKLMMCGLLELWVGNRVMFKGGPMARFPAMFHVPQLFKPNPIELPIMAIRREIQTQQYAYCSITPLYIQSKDKFGVKIIYSDPMKITRDALVGVILDGYLLRPTY